MSNQYLSLNQILALPIDDFIEFCYSKILLRASDKDGYLYYYNRLQNGYSRISIIEQFCQTENSSVYELKNIKYHLIIYRILKKPIIGFMLEKILEILRINVEFLYKGYRKCSVIQGEIIKKEISICLSGFKIISEESIESSQVNNENIKNDIKFIIQEIQELKRNYQSDQNNFIELLTSKLNDIHFQSNLILPKNRLENSNISNLFNYSKNKELELIDFIQKANGERKISNSSPDLLNIYLSKVFQKDEFLRKVKKLNEIGKYSALYYNNIHYLDKIEKIKTS